MCMLCYLCDGALGSCASSQGLRVSVWLIQSRGLAEMIISKERQIHSFYFEQSWHREVAKMILAADGNDLGSKIIWPLEQSTEFGRVLGDDECLYTWTGFRIGAHFLIKSSITLLHCMCILNIPFMSIQVNMEKGNLNGEIKSKQPQKKINACI